jgi:hypothetical protein
MAFAAAVLGGIGVLYAAWRGDYPAAVIIGVTLAVLLGTYVWSRGGDEDDDERQPRA